MRSFTTEDGRARFAELIALAASGERVVLTRRGQPMAALVSVEDLAALEDQRAAVAEADGRANDWLAAITSP
jgi:prevent-host-death family protein